MVMSDVDDLGLSEQQGFATGKLTTGTVLVKLFLIHKYYSFPYKQPRSVQVNLKRNVWIFELTLSDIV